ncbi:hypothetical protein HELRODRAFT_158602 [Helobdella robusta]|uniref:Endonuclease/exonuclease/phosphatase domain-containing protein n=1 Tax=Helobdella robusta TaxID=6412 RepID=T1EN04_HELRO|nr:hypothetical protein HELRODRAFT_158602 [Helobdella robusta]ESO12151.1 hypothetical protein HELRODRAFT_158602 [Helobdella robusta]
MPSRNTKSVNKAAACDKEGVNVVCDGCSVSFLVPGMSDEALTSITAFSCVRIFCVACSGSSPIERIVSEKIEAGNSAVFDEMKKIEKLNMDIKQQIDAIKTIIDEGDGKLSRMDAFGSKLCDEILVLKREMNRSFSEVVKSEVGRGVQAINNDSKSVQITLNKREGSQHDAIRIEERMKTLDDSLKNIRLSHNLTIQQRSDLKKLLDDAKKKEESCKEGFLYRVRGEVGKWKIVQFFAKKDSKSIMKKVDTVHGLICDGLDVMVLTETWHGLDGNFAIGLAKPPGFQFVDYIREHDPGHGGLIVYFRKEFKFKKLTLSLISTFEAIAIRLSIYKSVFILLAMYRPGSAPITVLFYDEPVSILEYLTILNSDILLMGDLNLHVERTADPQSIRLKEIFDIFQLVNHVNVPTHILGGTLDLVVSSHVFPVLNAKIYLSGIISDHSFIKIETMIVRPAPKTAMKSVRSWKRVDEEKFIGAILTSPVSKPCCNDDVEK